MTERRAFADILDECLERVLRRGETADACVADYPEHAAELRELLATALAVQRATAFTPSTDAKRAARLRLHDRLDRLQRRQGFGIGRAFPALAMGHRLAVTAVVLVLALVLGSTGTVLASSDSLPGDALYPVKRVAERTRLILAVTEGQEADVHARLLDRRTRELAAVTTRGRDRFVPRLARQIEDHAARAGALAAAPVQRVVATLPAAADAAASGAGTPEVPASGRRDQAPRPPGGVQVPADRLIELNQRLDALQSTLDDLQSAVAGLGSKAAVEQLQRSVRRNREQLKGVLLQADALHFAPDSAGELQAPPESTPAPAATPAPTATPSRTPSTAATPGPAIPPGVTPTPTGRSPQTAPPTGAVLSVQSLRFAGDETAKGILIRPVSATEWKAQTRVPGLRLVPTAGVFVAGQAVEVAVLLDRLNATPGEYAAGITITTNSPLGPDSMDVQVTVLAPAAATPTPKPAPAGVAVSPRALQFAMHETSKTFTITGSAPSGVEWAADARPFLTLSANKGKLAPREQAVITVKVDRSVMAPGIHATAVTVTTPLGAVNVEVVVLVQPSAVPSSRPGPQDGRTERDGASGPGTVAPRPAATLKPTPTQRDIAREITVKGYRQVEGRLTGVTLVRENGYGHVEIHVRLQDGTNVVTSIGGPEGAKLVKGDHAARLADLGGGGRVRLILEPERDRVAYVQVMDD